MALRPTLVALPALTALALAAPLPMAAAGAARQASSTVFDQHRPARSTGTTLAIDYVNPDDPAAKPYAVQRTVTELAPGTVIDTSVPRRCSASDAELVAQGASACPAGSRVGTGEVTLDTGLPNARDLENDVTLFNNTNQLILLIEPKGGGPRFVSRATVKERTITSDTPPLPGGPPDGFTAVKRVRLQTKAISAGGRNYATTPPTCIAGGWLNRTTFTYRDAVKQTVANRSPCTRPADRTAPTIALHGLPRTCAQRPFVARVTVHETGSGLASAQLSLDGRRLVRTARSTFSRRIRTGRLSSGRHQLTATARDHAGNRGRASRGFTVCAGDVDHSDSGDDAENNRVTNQPR